MNILAVSGSLRANSSNTRLLELSAAVAPPPATLHLFCGLEDLPHFNPDLDLEGADPPPAVAAWRGALRRADGVVLSAPEYAHGLPGSFKNALDWLVSSADLLGKPVLLLNASPAGGEFAQAQLKETLTMLGAQVLEGSLLVPFLPPGFWAEPTDARALESLRIALSALVLAVQSTALAANA